MSRLRVGPPFFFSLDSCLLFFIVIFIFIFYFFFRGVPGKEWLRPVSKCREKKKKETITCSRWANDNHRYAGARSIERVGDL